MTNPKSKPQKKTKIPGNINHDVERGVQDEIKRLLKAAEQGDASSQFNLAGKYYNQQDYQEAVKWCCKAAEQGYAAAQYNLGVCYDNGKGVPKDEQAAVKWYRKAAEQGDTAAKNNLALLLAKNSTPSAQPKQPMEKKSTLQCVSVEQPFGCPPPIVHCPICGKAMLDPDGGGLTECPHLAFSYVSEIGGFEYISAQVEQRTKVTTESEVSFETLKRRLKKAGYGNQLLVLEIVYGGMACGPVYSSVAYGFDYGTLAGTSEA